MNFTNPFPKYNFETHDINHHLHSSEAIVCKSQQNLNTSDCFLSFYSPAKNIRYVSSYFFNAIKTNRKPVLSLSGRPGEELFWGSQTNENWHPWLWSRYMNNNETTRDSWCNFFEPIEDIIKSTEDNINDVEDFYLYLACLSHVFRLNSKMESELLRKYINFDISQDMIGLQIRRGELVPSSGKIEESWSDKTASQYGGRPIYKIEDYMTGISMISKTTGIRNIYVSTDSFETIEYLEKNYTEYKFYYSKFEREKLLRYNGEPSTVALEFDVFRNQHLIPLYTESCLVDLLMLSKCKAFVGGMVWSEYGITGWLLQIAKNRKITQYYNVEGEFDMNGKQTRLLLL